MSFFKNSKIRLIFQIFRYLILLPINLLCSIIPVSRNVWVFGHIHGYTDNSKYVFKYVQQHYSEINAIWIVQNKTINVDTLYKDKFYYKYSLKGIFYTLVAKKFVYATGSSDISPLVPSFGRDKYQLWHGWPIKKIGLLSPETFPSSMPIVKSVIAKLLITRFDQYKYVFSHDKATELILSQSFSLPSHKVVNTGWPRFDKARPRPIVRNKPASIVTILYAPTWHTDNSTVINLKKLSSEAFQEFLSKNNYHLLVKLHPLEKNINIIETDNFMLVAKEDTVEQHLLSSDIFISDFSSLLVDASIDKEVYLFGHNLQSYIDSRGINKQYLNTYHDFFNDEVNDLIQSITHKQTVDFSVSLKKNTCKSIIEKIQAD